MLQKLFVTIEGNKEITNDIVQVWKICQAMGHITFIVRHIDYYSKMNNISTNFNIYGIQINVVHTYIYQTNIITRVRE